MTVARLPTKEFLAHTVTVLRDEFAVSVSFDGRRSEGEEEAIILQAAINEEDGKEIYLEIPMQRFASQGGVVHAAIRPGSFEFELDGHAGERLAGFYQWQIRFRIDDARYAELLDGLLFVFSRSPELLEIE